MPTIEIPDYPKLPSNLLEGYFSLALNSDAIHPSQRNAPGLYIFHDKTWFADCRHMLGWSREIIHCVKTAWYSGILTGPAIVPNWLCGHAFRLTPEKYVRYQVSGTDRVLSAKELVTAATLAAKELEAADVHLDQWGCDEHNLWPAFIDRHVQAKVSEHPILEHLSAKHSNRELHILLANWGNQKHHPEYGK
jgi:hypothetical protein